MSFYREILPLALMGLFMVEGYFLLTIRRRYFSIGMPLYRKRLMSPGAPSAPPDAERIFLCLGRSVLVPFVYRQFSETESGFRESFGLRSLFRIGYPTWMRGRLSFDVASREVIVTGYANFWMCAFFLYVGVRFLEFHSLSLISFFLVLFGLGFGIQRLRFRRVAEVAAGEWAKGRGPLPEIDPA